MKKVTTVLFACALIASAFGQSVEIDDVKGYKFQGVYPILSGTDMKPEGYYTHYQLEREKGVKTVEFSIINYY